MAHYPIYQDAQAESTARGNQLPFFIKKNTITFGSPLHHHDFMELSIVYEGHGSEIINGKSHTMRPGTVSMILPHHIHEIERKSDEPIRLYCCMFDIKLLFESAYDAELGNYLLQVGTQLPSFFDLTEEQFEQIKCILDDIFEAHNRSALLKNTYIRVKLIEALVLVIQYCALQEPESMTVAGSMTIQNQTLEIRDIIRFIHLNYCEPLSLKMLSQQFHMSVPYISRMFKEQTGQNFSDYIQTLRIKRACSLLVSTSMLIRDVSIDVGFEQFRTFSRVFRDVLGVTPREYRNQHIHSRGVSSDQINKNG